MICIYTYTYSYICILHIYVYVCIMGVLFLCPYKIAMVLTAQEPIIHATTAREVSKRDLKSMGNLFPNEVFQDVCFI